MGLDVQPLVAFVEVYLDKLVVLFTEWSPYVDRTVYLKVPGLDQALTPLSESLGFELGMLKYVLAMFLAYPLAGILSLLPGAHLKHLFSLLVGLWYAQEIFGGQWIHSFASALVSYLIVVLAPRKHIASLTFAFTMAYMSLSHLYRVYVDYLGWSLDFTGPQMILTIKLSSFAYNVYDGLVDGVNLQGKVAKLQSEVDQDDSPGKSKTRAKSLDLRMAKERLRYSIEEVPGPLEFFGYVYNFTTFLAGPAFEFKDYAAALEGTAFIDASNGGKITRPSSILAALSRLVQGVVCMALHLVGTAKFPIAGTYGAEVLARAPLQRWVYSWVSLFFTRMKYYFAWKVAEGSCIMAGFGFEGYTIGKDGKKVVKGWNGVSNMDVIPFELATTVAEASKAWNKGTQKWLQRYVYFRTGGSLIITYFVSAFWHGFYPGYYLFFFSMAFVSIVQREWASKVSKRVAAAGAAQAYNLLCIPFFSAFINYFSIVFQVLSWDRALVVWKSYEYWGHILTVAAYILCLVIPKYQEADKAKKDK